MSAQRREAVGGPGAPFPLRAPLVGRAQERERLSLKLERLVEGSGGCLAIEGAPGTGKSRLVAELRQATAHPLRWIEGRARRSEEDRAHGVVQELVRALLGLKAHAAPGEVDVALRETTRRLGLSAGGALQPFLARVAGAPLDASTKQSLARLTPENLWRKTLEALRALFEAAAERWPLVLVWEDLQWADPASLQALETLLPIAAERPLLMVLVFRSGEARLGPYEARWRAVPVDWLALGPLDRRSSAELLDQLLPVEDLPSSARDRILECAAGNAFFLEEVLRSLLAAGQIVREGDRVVARPGLEDLDVPRTLREVITRRLALLPEAWRAALQGAAVLGRVFDLRLLERLLHFDPGDAELPRALDRLQAAEFIRRLPAAGADPAGLEYIFKHATVQEAAYSGLAPERRRQLHLAAAEAIEQTFPDRLDELASILADHYRHAELPEKAILHAVRAGDLATAGYANHEAAEAYRSALALLDAHPEAAPRQPASALRCELNARLGEALRRMGRREEARLAFEEALAHTAPEDALRRCELHRKRHECRLLRSEPEAAERALQDALQALGTTQDEAAWWQAWIAVQLDRIFARYFRNDLPGMQALIEETTPVVERCGTPVQRASLLLRQSAYACQRDRYVLGADAPEYGRRAAALAENEDLEVLALALFNQGFAHLWQGYSGDLDGARRQLELALGVAKRIGAPIVEARALVYLGVVALRSGRVEEVRATLPHCTRAAGQFPEYVGCTHALACWLAWRDGRLDEAWAAGQRALATWRAGPAFPFEGLALWPMVATALARGQVEEAEVQARALLAPGMRPVPESLTERIASAGGLLAAGGHEGARATLAALVEEARGYRFL